MKKRIGIVFGTRPDAIKMAPVVFALPQHPDEFTPVAISTGQHRQMLDQVLQVFDVSADIELDLMRHNQTLNGLTRRILEAMDSLLAENPLDCLIVQGDTTTAFAAALAAFYRKVPVAHVEAGLRTGDFDHPFPEELNRVLIDRFATFCFAPTQLNRRTLLAENIPAKRIYVTGNTGIDALLMIRDRVCSAGPDKWNAHWRSARSAVHDTSRKLVLVTMHRRETFGARMRALLTAIRNLACRHLDWEFVYPVHLNPNVRREAANVLADLSNVHLIEALPYEPFVFLMHRAVLILTDSGGIQEEAPSLNKPVVV